jgi:hypothetical protein
MFTALLTSINYFWNISNVTQTVCSIHSLSTEVKKKKKKNLLKPNFPCLPGIQNACIQVRSNNFDVDSGIPTSEQ